LVVKAAHVRISFRKTQEPSYDANSEQGGIARKN